MTQNLKHQRWYLLLFLSSIFFATCSGCKESNGIENHKPENNVPSEVSPSPLDGLVMYEVNPRFYGDQATFQKITQDLPRIKDLGTTVVWLMPIQKPGQLKAIGSPYCIQDYTALNPKYGTSSDLHELVKTAHQLGMKVIIDWVANHTSWDHDWITKHEDWYTKDANGTTTHPGGTNWLDVADLDYESTDLRSAMVDAMRYWVSEYGIDGYRCDYAEGVPLDFWKIAIAALKKESPDLLMLAEGGDNRLYEAGFDLLYGWGAYGRLAAYYQGKGTLSAFLQEVKDETSTIDQRKQRRLRYVTNHDLMSENAMIGVFKSPEAALSAFALSTFVDGVPLLYSSQEVAPTTSLSFFEYRTLDLSAQPEQTQRLKEILSAYTQTVQVRTGSRTVDHAGGVVFITYRTDSEQLLVLVNTTGEQQSAKIPISWARKKVRSLPDGSERILPSEMILPSYKYQVYAIK